MQAFSLKVLLVLLLLSAYPLYSQSDKNSTDSNLAPALSSIPASQTTLIDSLINFSKQYLGSPYRGGGKGPNSFDCSGFTSFVFNNFGIKLGSSSGDQAEQLPTVAKNDIMPGDLVFFNGHRRGHRVGHVGLVVAKHDNGTFDFIHSASSAGISISHSESDYYNRRYVKAGRVFGYDSLIARADNTKTDFQPISNETTETNENYAPKQTQITVKKTIPAKYHTVKSGETLSSIAGKYGLTIAQLKKKNHLKKDFLSLKQRLKVSDEREIAVVEKVKPLAENKMQADSTKTKETVASKNVSNGQTASHTVKKGETLFSISKEYGISVNDIVEMNGLKTKSIFSGQRLKIRNENVIQSTELVAEKTVEIPTPKQEQVFVSVRNQNTHVVGRGETLQSISREYKMTIDALKELNNLSSDNIMAGQKLIVPDDNNSTRTISKQKTKTHTVKSGETLSEIAEKYHCTVKELKNWNKKRSNMLNSGEKLKILQ